MIRRSKYLILVFMLTSCASKQMKLSIHDLEKENKILRGDIARLQGQVQDISNDLLVVQSRVESHRLPENPVSNSMIGKPVPAIEAPKMFRTDKFLEDELKFLDDEQPQGISDPNMRFTNRDLSNLPPLPIGKNPLSKSTGVSSIEKEKVVSTPDKMPTLEAIKSEKPSNVEDPVAEAKYSKAYKKFTEQNYSETIRLMNEFETQYPNHQYSDNAIFWIGESYFQMKNYDLANLEFEKIIRKYPEGNKVPDALLRSGICMLKLTRPEKAKSSFDLLIKKYPESVAARRAKVTLGEL